MFLDKFKVDFKRETVQINNKKVLSIFGVNSDEVSVNSLTAMQHTTVYACVNVKAQGIGAVPLVLYKKNEKGREKATKHKLYKLFNGNINPLMTSQTWREMVVQDLELRGTHFSQIVRNNAGQIVALYPLIHDNMTVEIKINSKNIPELSYRYIPTTDDKTKKTNFTQDQILRIVGLPSENGILGVSPISQNAKSLALGMQTLQFGNSFFSNGANGSGILTTDKTLSSNEAIDRLSKQFGDRYKGLANSKKPIVLQDGMKWQPITISNNDSQFLETRQFQKNEIASIFRVSPHLINELSNATFSNITELSLEHVKYCLLPTATKIEMAINTQLLSESEQEEYYSEHNFNGLMRGDMKTRFEAYSNGINSGVLKPNEARKMENLDNDDFGDKLVMNGSYQTLENIEKEVVNEN